MNVTSLIAVGVSFRSASSTKGSSAKAPSASAVRPAAPTSSLTNDTVELSKSTDTATATGQSSKRSETLLRTLDADRDGLVSKEEFTDGAIELLRRASIRFHHHRLGKGEGIEKRDNTWTQRLEDAFARVDANEDGVIDTAELTSALPRAAQRPVRRQPRFVGRG
jgi:hypothetical protein